MRILWGVKEGLSAPNDKVPMLPPDERSNLIISNRIVLDSERLGVRALAGVYREYIRVRPSYVVVFTRQ